ncbi:QueT transporter family protein [Clostridium sp. SYSU_GA19001]|uniref:QueT transporter family protein n=1 Tax=Clostridium caldaquaticum TaxID=2940653 RepID=UPI00207748D3|nr:QueT transporter family protein [Clostridium caldaquaticum]MCM8711315.1 QueT transporter family protein [Clostridium caldaquaticum]
MIISTKKIVFGALVGALYAALTLSIPFMSFLPNQLRVSEALTILPYFSSYSIFGIFIGCVVANILSPYGALDMVIGSLASLIAAVLTYYIGKSSIKYKKLIAPMPAVIVNAVMIGFLITYSTNTPFLANTISVGLGELISCYLLGLPLLLFIDKNDKLKKYLR